MKKKWLYALLLCFIFSLLLGALSGTWGILLIILGGGLVFGYAKGVLRLARREDEKANLSCLFDGFSQDFAGNLVLYILKSIFIFLWTLLLIIPGIVKSYAYSMSWYIKNDNPNMDPNECITQSRRMMYGHKWELFVLDLSFIGWYIVGMLCLGIGVLWVSPYHELSRALFYLEISGQSDTVTVIEA